MLFPTANIEFSICKFPTQIRQPNTSAASVRVKFCFCIDSHAQGIGAPTQQDARTGTSGLQTQLIRLTGTLEAIMDTVLFTDHGIVVFAITASAMALIFSVLGLATPHQTRSDINRELKGLP